MRDISQEAIFGFYRVEARGECYVVIPDIAGRKTFGISRDRSEGIEAPPGHKFITLQRPRPFELQLEPRPGTYSGPP